ncbi:hypothetical protein T459_29747 [Capsicum annuum]|uniref:Disease resistance protein winged helix domain-containing protein n=1 Tax=Capsicum annuum TaxID=4072 RepID=A0A2G2Y6H6_CAPAN|nr:hypothetical protein T459_29747 [Capsicum annuum]
MTDVEVHIKDKDKQTSKESLVQDFSSSAEDILDVRNNMVGRDDHRRRLLEDMTTGYSGEPKVISIIGMGGVENLSLQMGFMDQDESWNLFKSAAFSNEALPSEFETIGKQILHKCQGLPLTIVGVAGLLRKSRKTIEDWESVVNYVESFVTNDPDKQCSHVLGLSYNHLTSDLKARLLYFEIFLQDIEIPVNNLMRLWMDEGFLNLEKDLEGEVDKCLQDLINRCLVLVSEKSLDETKIRSYKMQKRKAQIHDFVLDCDPNDVSSERQSLSIHKMQPFKRWTGDEISDLPYGLCRALRIPGHHQLTDDDDNNNLLKQTRSIFVCGYHSSTFILKSELIHFKFLKSLRLESSRD